MASTKVFNKSNGPRGFHKGGKIVMLQAGETREIDLTADEKKAADASGHFEFGADATKAVKAAEKAEAKADDAEDGK